MSLTLDHSPIDVQSPSCHHRLTDPIQVQLHEDNTAKAVNESLLHLPENASCWDESWIAKALLLSGHFPLVACDEVNWNEWIEMFLVCIEECMIVYVAPLSVAKDEKSKAGPQCKLSALFLPFVLGFFTEKSTNCWLLLKKKRHQLRSASSIDRAGGSYHVPAVT